jgi:KUP system potassium uptake protein
VLVEEEMSTENDLPLFDNLIMDGYEKMKFLAGRPEKWFGLDGSMVTKELVPVVIAPRTDVSLKRIR